MKMKMGMRIGRVIRDGILIIFAILFLLPLYWMFSLSLKDTVQAAGEPWAIPNGLHFENFSAAWQRIDIPNLLKNSFIYTAGALVLCLAVSVMIAYAITRMRMKHANSFRMYFTIGMLVPIAVMMIPVYRLVMTLGIKGTYWSLILPYAAFTMASAILMICAFFRSIPVEMEEAAAIDGCNVYRTFISIMVPMVKPALVTQAMMVYITNWNEYALASVLAMGEDMRSIPLALDLFFGQFNITNWGEVGAAVAITSLPVIVVFMFCNKQIEQAMCGSSGLK
ncbi:carbohydrate ABC transporter permease [Faecalicatena orotica]|uniref:Carbohydrate ABC transporter membrane protein 2 (CUT1 family) n=1 Tax=Faecalicatena orotica TaxID=1544 RepID=A0A2Y9BMA8_9FIRM|nr:carbohydrate ABC transporter permease [Faecalicatena orotica]PWJ19063.1 carbohydrate ABC transporter membrane protein 2 (CUT1 family) [Faecalicatena orotica]SSA58706.1 carbohydrate ABC transporter membrane protein 2, CUT1 family [Faecalicatena orotica]